jgi:hypothetical protein
VLGGNCGAPCILGRGVEADVGGDAVQPRPDAQPRLEALAILPRTEERLLHSILGVIERAQHSITVHLELVAIGFRNGRERLFIDRSQDVLTSRALRQRRDVHGLLLAGLYLYYRVGLADSSHG